MSEIEQIQSKLSALHQRVERLETMGQLRARACSDCEGAKQIAREAGLDAAVLIDPLRTSERKQLAQLLRRTHQWSAARISRVLVCSERTVERWLGMAV